MRATICLIVGLAATPALAQPVGTTVEAIGCPSPGIENGCIILRAVDGRVYNISSARPTPPIGGPGIKVIGVVSGKVSLCMQGAAILDPVQYTVVPGIRCAQEGMR